jgi:hypothetical protein
VRSCFNSLLAASLDRKPHHHLDPPSNKETTRAATHIGHQVNFFHHNEPLACLLSRHSCLHRLMKFGESCIAVVIQYVSDNIHRPLRLVRLQVRLADALQGYQPHRCPQQGRCLSDVPHIVCSEVSTQCHTQYENAAAREARHIQTRVHSCHFLLCRLAIPKTLSDRIAQTTHQTTTTQNTNQHKQRPTTHHASPPQALGSRFHHR